MSKSLYDCACGARRVAALGVTELGVTLTVYQCPACGQTVGKVGHKSAEVQEAVARLGVDGHSVNFPFPDARNFQRAELVAAVSTALNIKKPFNLQFREPVYGHGRCSASVEADCLSKNCLPCIMRGGNVLAYHSARMQPKKNGIARYPVPAGYRRSAIRRETAIFANTAAAIATGSWEFWANVKCCEQHLQGKQIPRKVVAADYLEALLYYVGVDDVGSDYEKLLRMLGNIVNGSYDKSASLDYTVYVPAEYLLLCYVGVDDVGASIAETEDIIRQHLSRHNASRGDRLVYLGPLTVASLA